MDLIREALKKIEAFLSAGQITDVVRATAEIEADTARSMIRLLTEALDSATDTVSQIADGDTVTIIGNEGTTRNSNAFVEDKYYARQIDKWDSLKDGSYVTVGRIQQGSPLNQVGIPDGKLYFDVSKILKEMKERKDRVSPEIMKGIPTLLGNPFLITEYVDKNGLHSINVYGNLFIGSSPVVVGVMIGKHRNGSSISKIQTVHPNRNVLSEATDENTLYLGENKKETKSWFQALGTQTLPLGGTKFGFIRSISDSQKKSNTLETKKAEGERRSIDIDSFAKDDKTIKELKFLEEYVDQLLEISGGISV